MNRIYKAFTVVLLLAMLAPTCNTALATLTFSLSPSSSGIAGFDRTYDIMATTDTDLGAMEMIIEGLLPGSIYQNSTAPDNPNDVYASYVTFNSSIGANDAQTHVFGGAVDLGGDPAVTFNSRKLDIGWVPEQGQTFTNGVFQVGRFTLADWADVNYDITGFDGVLGTQGTPISGNIAPLGGIGSINLSMVETPGAPAGYKFYDFYADVDTSVGAMQLMLETYHPGDIYQNNAAPDDPNEASASYVTVGPLGPNEPETIVFGGAVDLGGAPAATFGGQNIDIGWVPTGGTLSGTGLQQIARVTLQEKAQATYTAKGWQMGNDTPDTISGVIDSPLSVSMVEVPGAPAGYTAYDFIADVSTDMGPLELILNTDTLGDIYQNSVGDDPDVGAEEFDTYVTIGGGPDPANTQVLGGAVEIGGAASETFDTQNIDIAWMPGIGNFTGRGEFQIARVVLKDTATGSWDFISWQAGINDDIAFTLSGDIGGAVQLPGDVDGNGYVSGPDLTAIITNWGMTGATREQGDLSGDGTVAGADYTEVVTYWGTGTPPPEPGSIPEPATLAILALGVLALLRRRRL